MPRHGIITRSWTTAGILWTRKHTREYRVTYIDDWKERAEAVAFFGDALSPAMDIPRSLNQMSERDAQQYLDLHPMQEQWRALFLDRRMSFIDDDLHRLKHLPELETLHSHARHLTDRGVSFIPQISELRKLVLYSPLITDRCLQDIAKLCRLEAIDLQGSHLISRKAFDSLLTELPKLVEIYPPSDRPLSALVHSAQIAKQNKRSDNDA